MYVLYTQTHTDTQTSPPFSMAVISFKSLFYHCEKKVGKISHLKSYSEKNKILARIWGKEPFFKRNTLLQDVNSRDPVRMIDPSHLSHWVLADSCPHLPCCSPLVSVFRWLFPLLMTPLYQIRAHPNDIILTWLHPQGLHFWLRSHI